MDNCNVQFFKDGNDIIVVFKNSSKELTDIITQMMTAMTNSSIKEIQGLTAPNEVPSEKPQKFEEYEELIPDFLKDDCGDPIFETNENTEEKKAETTETIEQPSKDVIDLSVATKAELGVYLENKYANENSRLVIDYEIKKKGYGDILAFINFAPEEVIRNICLTV